MIVYRIWHIRLGEQHDRSGIVCLECEQEMDSHSLKNKLKEHATCSICSKAYTRPKELPCSHVFCLDCLKIRECEGENAEITITCRLCKSEFTVPENGSTADLPDCTSVKNLIEMLAFEEKSISLVTCGNCDKKREEVWFCFNCNKLWCHDCLTAHDTLKEKTEHRVLLLTDFQDQDFEEVLQLSLRLPAAQIPATFAKKSENDNQEMPSATEGIMDITSRLNSERELSDDISNRISRLQETIQLFDYRLKVNKEKMVRSVQSLISTLRVKEQAALEEMENTTKKDQEAVRKKIDELQVNYGKRKNIISQIEYLVQRQTDEDLGQRATAIDELFSSLPEPQFDTVTSANAIDWKTVDIFVENKQIFESLQESGIGRISAKRTTTEAKQCTVKWFDTAAVGLKTRVEVTTHNSRGEQCYCPGDYFTVALMSSQNENTVVNTHIRDKRNGSFIISFFPTEAGKYLPILRVNGEPIGAFPPVIISERSFEPVGCITNVTSPWGVAVNSKNQIVLTETMSDHILVVNEEGKLLNFFGSDVLGKPTGICIDENDRIYVTNKGNNNIILFSPQGEFITAIHKGESLQQPRGLSLDAEGNLLVCDTGNRCLKKFSPNGSLLRTIGKGCFRSPCGCMCFKGKVFVTDRDFHRVKVFSVSDGKFLYEFGGKETDSVVLHGPTGIAMDKAQHILVCCSGLNMPHRVHVYNLDGKFVGMFGENLKGSELGQFDTPCSLTVLPDGRIVVCDLRNSRLPIFQ